MTECDTIWKRSHFKKNGSIMQTLTITAKDDVILKIKTLIDNFAQNNTEVLGEVDVQLHAAHSEVSDIPKFSIEELGGILSDCSPMTDEAMEIAISEAIVERALLRH